MEDQKKKFHLYDILNQIYENNYIYSGISFSYSFNHITDIIVNDVEFTIDSTINNIEIGLGKHHLHFIFYTDDDYFMFSIEYINIKNFVLSEG